MGISTWASAIGDDFCAFLGDVYPSVIREVNKRYSFVGEAHIDGIMDGEALDIEEYDPQELVFV